MESLTGVDHGLQYSRPPPRLCGKPAPEGV
jgi:hypothetical protein